MSELGMVNCLTRHDKNARSQSTERGPEGGGLRVSTEKFVANKERREINDSPST